jgi:imidazoleglycerol-phosphate dehydratase
MSIVVPRKAKLERKTRETSIVLEVGLDGTGEHSIATPLPFLSHMLEQIARHGAFDLELTAQGDVDIDGHHTTEDIGIVLGKAVHEALGDHRGIRRYGSATLPMDEALVTAALDLSGRPFFVWRVPLPKAKLGNWDVELAEVFFEAFARSAQANLHFVLQAGSNLHHIVEISFKAFARALREAVELDPRAPGVPSTKGMLV